ncbi:hypothetical protein [Cognatiyoonia koreensis]|nr:hypothetical protein [Cognatiyoonia koreensis]
MFALPLTAQDAVPEPPNCPLNVVPGTWDLTVTGTQNATARIGGEVPVPPIADALTFFPSCEGSLMIESRGGIQTELSGRSDGEFPSTVQGTGTIVATVKAEWRITIQSPTTADGTLSLGGIINQLADGEALHYRMNYVGDKDEQHPACTCPTQLRAALSDQINDAKKLRSLFANPAYYGRPAAFSPDLDPLFPRWKLASYDALIDYMYANENAEYDDAVAYADSVTNDAGQVLETSQESQSNGSSAFSASGKTWYDNDQCNMTVTSGNDSCYADIMFAAVSAHEGVHFAECNQNKSMHKTIESKAASEVRAYTAEIEYLRGWIPNNCSGPVANVTD